MKKDMQTKTNKGKYYFKIEFGLINNLIFSPFF